MNVRINSELRKSRNPLEHGYTITNRKGKIIHVLGDGYLLIEFSELLITKMVSVDKKKRLKSVALQWYVHEEDLQAR